MVERVALGKLSLSTSVSLANSHFTKCSILLYHLGLVQQTNQSQAYKADSIPLHPQEEEEEEKKRLFQEGT
jgi:hypothetical protein